tara:strand:- start:822 stop:923 length:102 start_codon:yes stop_codon:yes gene_type:complete
LRAISVKRTISALALKKRKENPTDWPGFACFAT